MKAIKPKLVYVKQKYIKIWPYILAQKLDQNATVSFIQRDDVVIEVIDFKNPSYQHYFPSIIDGENRIYVLVKYDTGSIEFLWRTVSLNQFEMIFWYYENGTTPNTLVKELFDEFLDEISYIKKNNKKDMDRCICSILKFVSKFICKIFS
ncbi:MAG: hypothetical protein LBI18_08430 [Planctomycetaceae bacterium]|jgi:hypothetical protein|nr:hypothetical protein [Planctomycetaceae bacterium]